jgi:hypothetical protein
MPEEHFLLFGGQRADPNNRTLLEDLFIYQPATRGDTGEWIKLNPSFDASMQGTQLRRSGHAAAVHTFIDPKTGHVASDLYVFGGYYMRGWADRTAVSGDSLFLRYSVGDNTWYRVPATSALPPPRFFASLVMVQLPFPMLVLYGGEHSYNRSDTQLLSDVWAFDLIRSVWLPLQTNAGPPPREGHVAAAFGTKMVIQGGKRYLPNTNVVATDSTCAQLNQLCSHCDFWVLDLSETRPLAPAATWTQLSGDDSGTGLGADDCTFPLLRHAAVIRALPAGDRDRWWTVTPLALLAGWLSIAAPVNLITVATGNGDLPTGISPTLLAISAVVIVGLIGLAVTWRLRLIAYVLPICWGLVGVFAAEESRNPALAFSAIIVSVVVLIGAGLMVLAQRRRIERY